MNPIFEDLFVFEMANNHQGQTKHAENIIAEMGRITKKYGIKAAVKFQYRNLDTFIHRDFKGNPDVKHIGRFESTRLSDNQFRSLLGKVKAQGMLTMVTPFDEVSVQKCIDHDVDIIKVASCSVTDWPLLKEIKIAKKPTIVSTGGATLEEIDNVISYLKHKNFDFAIMHCVSLYPTPNDQLHMAFLDKLKRRFPDVLFGYSGHEAPDNLDVVKIAVAKGARMLERHVGVETDKIKLNKYSMTPDQVENWIQAALIAKEILGNSDKAITEGETAALRTLQRGVYASKAIKAGQEIAPDMVYFAMPIQENQISSGEFGAYRKKVIATKSYKAHDAISEKTVADQKIATIRSVLHEAKGMINEGGVVIGTDFSVEVSHHYGVENLRDTGAVLIDIINREYCKKLIIMIPGQKHPSHKHKRKEETFHLLFGSMTVDREGEILKLKAGDQLLVERGLWHSFVTEEGVIFEEVSTTHYRNDSIYKDPEIQSLDPLERKTILKDW